MGTIRSPGRSLLRGSPGQFLPGQVRRPGGQLFAQLFVAVAAEGQDLHGTVPVDRGFARIGFLDDTVEVAAAEAERAQGSSAWMLVARQPRPFLGIDVKRRTAWLQAFQRLFDLDRR